MHRAHIASLAFAGALAATLFGASAVAQSGGFSLNRFDPSERGSDWFAAESLDFRDGSRLALGAVLDWAHKPLVFYDDDGDESAALVGDQVYVHVGGAYLLGDRLRLAVNLPLALVNSGDNLTGTQASLSIERGTSVGDARIAADARLFGQYRDAATGAIGVGLYVPTGSRAAFTGDGKVRLVIPRFSLAGDIGAFTYGMKLGFNYRAQNENFDGSPFGSEALFALAAGVRAADGKLVMGPELYGSTVLSDDGDGAFARKTTPVELVLGGHYRAGDLGLGLGAGPGLTRGYGAPKVRVLASIEWFPEPKKKVEPKPGAAPKDADGDGIHDDEDACVNDPGPANDDPEKHGCPLPGDRDGDGIVDDDDACPDVEGEKTDDPKTNGCPPPDTDGDGVLDRADACVTDPGPKSDDPAKNGCPLPKDRDGDGIVDGDDACPDAAGPANSDPKKHGCPKAQVVGAEIKIFERVEFDTNKATIRSESDGVLTAVFDILKQHTEIEQVSIEGHTDSRGNRKHNIGLSKRRAAQVVKWLVDKGIDASRLSSQGFGPDKPRDSNDTEEGRQENRRVEFLLKETGGPPGTE